MLRVVCLGVLVLLMAGCAAPNKFSTHAYASGAEYPYISVMVNDGYVHQSTSCGQYGCSTYTDQTHLFVLSALRASGKFQRVDINNGLARHKVMVAFDRQEKGSGAANFGKMMLGALTIFLLPMPYEYRYEASFSVMEGDDILKNYEYHRDSDELTFLFIDVQSAKNNAVKSMVDNFLQDLENDGVLRTKLAAN
ncbi:hypothetical protein [Pseudomonas sp. NPDC079086]|uniref:hypothetical protein n=1 Tax=unclassified Pseudomonas TaxID=196821 RepID=UPI0037C5FFD9